ncbi:unnamed protein product [Phaedon cochleariae]|uniref:Uncharacterized protein n=1 Tax=Phaedon cochleariae TaxID=80249 RepID=A0A9N9SGC0_PHACE|nr:unnamed protein product [Phaedon cochleariae]
MEIADTDIPSIQMGARSVPKTPTIVRRIEDFEIESDFENSKKRAVTSQSRIMISPDVRVSEGKEIIRYYKKNNCLNDTYRKKLVNISVDYLIGFFDRNSMPSTYSREELARSIVVVFPKLKDPDSPKGYEAFYEPATQKGFITTRLRTIFRKKNADVESRRNTGRQSDEFEKSSQHVDEQENLVETMKYKDGSNDAAEIHEITKKTFWYRRKTGCDYNKYPRFFDTKGLISLEFKLMYPDAKKLSDTFPIYINKIFEVYHHTLHSKSEEITNDMGDNVRSTTC